jgi:hypothetical protein
MKMQEALAIINKTNGYMVTFEWVKDGLLTSDYFPDKDLGDILFATEDKAWEWAQKFADKTWGRCVNIYVIDSVFQPVLGYKERTIRNRV